MPLSFCMCVLLCLCCWRGGRWRTGCNLTALFPLASSIRELLRASGLYIIRNEHLFHIAAERGPLWPIPQFLVLWNEICGAKHPFIALMSINTRSLYSDFHIIFIRVWNKCLNVLPLYHIFVQFVEICMLKIWFMEMCALVVFVPRHPVLLSAMLNFFYWGVCFGASSTISNVNVLFCFDCALFQTVNMLF